jgi:acyl carrier protein
VQSQVGSLFGFMISKERLNGRIIEVLSEELSVDPKNIGIDEKLEDLDFDSVDFIEAVFALEEEFEVEFPSGFEDANFVTLGDLVDLIRVQILKTRPELADD